MAPQTQGADVVDIAFASALNNRKNMIRVPEALANALLQSPVGHEGQPLRTSGPLQSPQLGDGIDSTTNTDALVAKKDLLPQICRL